MVLCYFFPPKRWERITGNVAVLLGSGTLLGLGGYFLVTAENCRREAGVLLGMGLLFGLLGIWNEGLMTREYAIDTEGITLRYWKRKTVFYPWSQISKIYAYERHAGSARDEVIRCTIGEPTKAPQGIAHHWSGYEFFRFRRVLTVEYTPERLEAFKLCSGRDVPDYRYQ